VFSADRDPTRPLVVGSVKTNLGHLEGAAGVTAIIKVVQALWHRAIPPHLHFTTPSPHIPWSALPVRIPTAAEPWEPIAGRRIAGVSSFGFSGTNAHVVLEEAPAAAATSAHERTELLPLSARDEAGLAALASRYAAALKGSEPPPLADLAYTASVGRARFPQRAVLTARSGAELADRLGALAEGRSVEGLRVARVARRDRLRVAFLFTGQGAQYAGMTRGLYDTAPAFAQALDRCASLLAPHLDRPLLDVLFGPGPSTVLDETRYTQPALFAVEYAMAELWRSWGIEPMAVMGHSVGEYVAACVAGVLSLEDGLRLIATRGRLMQALPPGGAMMAIFAPEAAVRAEMASHGGRVSVAAVNTPGQVVISGEAGAVESIGAVFSTRGVRCQALKVSHAFHSVLVEPMLDAFEQVAAGITFSAPRVRLISNLTGTLADPAQVSRPGYWREHVREAVRFEAGLRTLATLKPDVCIEIGPHPTLLAFAEATFGSEAPLLVPTLRRGRPDREQALEALGSMYLAGADIDWRAVHDKSGGRVTDLPTYPFRRERYWFAAAPVADRHSTHPARTGHPLLGTRLRSAARQAVFESVLRPDSPAFLADHRVQGRVVVPATAYLETLLAAARSVLDEGAHSVEDMTIEQAMLLDDDAADGRTVQAVVDPAADGTATAEIFSQALSASPRDPWIRHVRARLTAAVRPAAGSALAEARARCITAIDPAGFYAGFVRRGLNFGPAFRSVHELWQGSGEACGRVELVAGLHAEASRHAIHPVLLDGCLQLLAAALPGNDEDTLYLPVAIGRFALHAPAGIRCWGHATLGSAASSDTAVASIRIFSEAGALVGEVGDVRLKRVSSDALARLGSRWLQDALLEVAWPEAPATDGSDTAMRWSTESLSAGAAGAAAELRLAADLDRYDAFLPQLDRLCVDYVAEAMTQLGWRPAPGDEVVPESLADELGVVANHRRLFARLLEILGEAGQLTRQGRGWVVRQTINVDPPGPTHARLLVQYPAARAELELTGRAGAGMAQALRGEVDPIELLFPGGSIETAERLYRDSPPARVMNGLMAALVARAANEVPSGRPFRILEIGAGTGGTTAHVVPTLSSTRVEYTFTDVGPLFVARARERFANVPGMRFDLLDLERDPEEQGFAGRQFDLIIASNVVHATRDLRRTLNRIRRLVAPGGMLAMLEVTAPQHWFDLTVGLTEGWWAFQDHDLRPGYPTVTRERWLSLLGECGFVHMTAVPNGGEPSHGVLGRQALLVGQASDQAPTGAQRPWIILADRGGTVDALVARLRARGERCVIARPGKAWLRSGDAVTLDPADPEHFRQMVEECRRSGDRLAGVVYAWALDTAPETERSHTLEPADDILGALHLSQALVRDGTAPRLWLLTRGGQDVRSGDGALIPSQGTLWGFGRTLLLEHPELSPVIVDLDPSSEPGADADGLLSLLAASPDEPQVALRAGKRRVARLAALGPAPVPAPEAPWRLVAATPSLDALQRVPIERSLPGPGLVEIAVEATGLNFKDVLNVLGMYPGDPGPLGGECAGRIVAVGQGVDHVKPGDDVLAVAGGSFASHVIARADLVHRRPPAMSVAEAASFPIAYLTAHFGLHHVAGLGAGERVLVHAAAGGVGLAAVRLAQRAGAEVFATAGAPWKRDLLRSMGVRHVYDSRSVAFADEILRDTGGRGVDVILNSLAGEQLDASFRVLAPGGRFVELGKRGIWSEERVAALGLGHRYTIVDWGETARNNPALVSGMLADLVADAGRGLLPPLPRHEFDIEHAQRAFRLMARAHHAGRVVLRHHTPGASQTATVSRNGTYLVTGGMSGLGLVVARWLADNGAGRIVLVGRRGVTQAATGELADLRRRTAVETVALDVSSESGLGELLARIRESGPPLRGVFHSAGVVDDAGLLAQDSAHLATVFAAKVVGGRLLDRLTRADPLDYFVLFSSMASVLGSRGQANHSAANGFLDVLAAARRSEGLPGLAINWGPWTEVGAAADRALTDRLAAQGIGAVTPAQGLQAFERAIVLDRAQVLVQPADWERVRTLDAGRAALLAAISHPARPAEQAAATASAGSSNLREQLAELPPGRKRPQLATFVRERALKALGVDPTRSVDPRVPLGELGLDSLLAVELRNTLGSAVGRILPATLLFDYPTLDTLTDFLLTEVFGEAIEGTATAAAEPQARNLVDAIEDLSDEEVDRRLAARGRKS
jgi:acyl transferase domain-containing protein